ncbi:hypothetical protein K435DRAFT_807631 [Dendrothele bispora CBS 962.96]|uniref:Uncharacterized protein n=1 Tax=Dendrothele bispora (strain CBS 962.96) TaxID=1314807 RepID=A0A4V4HCH2_DENBC|nr:hypothetical protein K435DRAFT_807631 [Dendrothele bispora CBS 962.96]
MSQKPDLSLADLLANEAANILGAFSLVSSRPVYGISPTWNQRFQDSAISAIPYTISVEWFSLFNYLIGDAIIAWRAYVLWPQSRIIRALLFLLFLGSAVSCVYNSIKFVIDINQVVVNKGNVNAIAPATSANMFLSFGLNFFATSFILIRVWMFRRTMKSASIRRAQSTAYQILLLLTESTNDPTSFSVDSAALAYFVFIDLSPAVSGINPLLVIIIIANKKSVLDGYVSHPSINASIQPTNDPSSLSTDPSDDIELGGQRNRTLDHRISTLMFSVKPDHEGTPDSVF